MVAKFRPEPPQIDVPLEPRRPLIPSAVADSRIFPGWGPRI
jgi:hypothetical protein